MKPETLFLKLVVFLMSLPILAVCILWVPGVARDIADTYPEVSYLHYPALIGVYAAAITYFVALYQAFRLLTYIDKNEAFSDLSVTALKNIKYCAVTICVMFAAVEPLLYYVGEVDDAPGLILLGLIIMFASLVIAVFAAVLQQLLRNAIDIKSENDLTV